ncbi:hypothetical protein SAMN02745136_00481 [Anaerocolumna jejuensis DSM 15929]|uniref:Uncharacterized protein n=1 Tax=Anaerocolumna jejuensis DSM 15929 TaxID=1121322 RepID=A0A1M6KJX8_9FIRM|nr:hypothetical protein SAMN02745136_00481 [Anaerocolumna jejuensis DSM 15929]
MKKLIKKIITAIDNLQIQPSTYYKFSIVFILLNTTITIVKLFI